MIEQPLAAGVLGDVALDAIQIRGAVELEPTADGVAVHRLPAWARAQVPSDFMAQTCEEAAGVRLAFRTAARTLELVVRARRMVPDASGAIPPAWYELTAAGA